MAAILRCHHSTYHALLLVLVLRVPPETHHHLVHRATVHAGPAVVHTRVKARGCPVHNALGKVCWNQGINDNWKGKVAFVCAEIIYVCVCVCIYMCVCMCACISACVCVCMYVYANVKDWKLNQVQGSEYHVPKTRDTIYYRSLRGL